MNDGGGGAPRKKILFGVTRSAWGGAQRYVFDIASNLDPHTYDVTVMGGPKGRLIELLKTRDISYKEIASLDRGINPWKELRSFFSIISIVRDIHPDILHLNSPKMAGIGALAGRLLRVPQIITTIHGWSFGREWGFLARALIFLSSWVSALLADRIICITERDFKTAKKMPFIGEKTVFIPNGIEMPGFLPKESARKKLIEMAKPPEELEGEPVWLGTVTRMIREKDLETMIRGIAKLRIPYPLLILGTGPEEERMKTLAQRIAPNRVFFLGFIPNAEIYLKAFSLFLLTSVKEGLPYVLLEAAAAEVPIIATDVGGIPDIMSDESRGHIIAPKDPNALATAIEEVMENPDFKSEKAREHTQSGFTLKRMIEETSNLY